MNKNSVAQVFCLMGNIAVDEALTRMPIITLSIEEVKSRMRDEADIEEYDELLTYVCAAHAYYRHCLIEFASQPQGSFSAGGISINTSGQDNIARAKKLRDEFWASASFLLNDSEEFYFSVARGDEK